MNVLNPVLNPVCNFLKKNSKTINMGIIMLFIIFKNNNFIHLRKIAMSVFFVLLLQIFLGILTILSGAQIILASIHQIGSIFLVATSLILVFKNSKIS